MDDNIYNYDTYYDLQISLDLSIFYVYFLSLYVLYNYLNNSFRYKTHKVILIMTSLKRTVTPSILEPLTKTLIFFIGKTGYEYVLYFDDVFDYMSYFFQLLCLKTQ